MRTVPAVAGLQMHAAMMHSIGTTCLGTSSNHSLINSARLELVKIYSCTHFALQFQMEFHFCYRCGASAIFSVVDHVPCRCVHHVVATSFCHVGWCASHGWQLQLCPIHFTLLLQVPSSRWSPTVFSCLFSKSVVTLTSNVAMFVVAVAN